MTDSDDIHPKRLANPAAKRPTLTNREMDRLVKACWDAGWWCVRAGNNHVKRYAPSNGQMEPIPSTPSGSRTYRNKVAALRRKGLRI